MSRVDLNAAMRKIRRAEEEELRRDEAARQARIAEEARLQRELDAKVLKWRQDEQYRYRNELQERGPERGDKLWRVDKDFRLMQTEQGTYIFRTQYRIADFPPAHWAVYPNEYQHRGIVTFCPEQPPENWDYIEVTRVRRMQRENRKVSLTIFGIAKVAEPGMRMGIVCGDPRLLD